ncbi:von Willebrand factor A domain-containing protein 5B1 [Rhinatrema bivittatum]|uniref:von Willebrand factor A domain-containing protein 5B1 n=1 Tax=Rhinatrema bivittatum TaxID=194408 RepID=UPI00112DCE84|nr:von Willebrand factor A domain-containing protein 5B1 [Rhinatrema bivittatum]
MPGLLNRSSGAPLPLTAAEISSCVSGYALGMTASLTYSNPEPQSIEGLFVYPLNEYTTVVGFEAVICRRIVTVQIKDKAKIDDCYYDCCGLSNGRFQDGNGRIVLDEDLERIIFVANLGAIPSLENVSILISTSSELQTLPSGAVRVLLPAVCVPRVYHCMPENPLFPANQLRLRERHQCGAGTSDQANKLCLATLLETEAVNATEYEFSFHLEIRGPYLLAGVESPTHEIRADADPSAPSAKSITITLANKHTYDRPVEIVIHPSEPHLPHILMEEGDMTAAEYEQYLKGKSDFIKGAKKDPSAEKKTEIIRKRLSKDISHNPVVMMNFCHDLHTVQPDLTKSQGEFIFLLDRSGSMSGVNISRVKDAMLVILKSLMPASLFNIIGFGSTFKTLFPSSQTYSEESLATACENIKKIRADMGGTNILSPLNWIIRQPVHRGHPRLLFLLTDGAVSNTGKVIELMRHHSFSTRCYSFGIGQNACRRLVQGLASVSKGSAEFLVEGERLQPKMIKSLKKAMAPVLSDVSIEWVFPETTEVLISPVSASYLFPGDRLVGYAVVCDTSRYLANPRSDKRRRYVMMHSQESGSSVFFRSQEESAGNDDWKGPREDGPDRTPEFLAVTDDLARDSELDSGVDPKSPSRRRAYSTNQIADHDPTKKAHTFSDPSAAVGKNPLHRTQIQELLGQSGPEPWHADLQVTDKRAPSPGACALKRPTTLFICWALRLHVGTTPFTASPYISTTKIRGAGARRPSLLHQSCLSFCHDVDSPQPQDGLQLTITGRFPGQLEIPSTLNTSSDSQSFSSPGDFDSAQHPSFTFETETALDSAPQDRALDDGGEMARAHCVCKAVVKGLQGKKAVQWEVAFDILSLFRERESREDVDGDLWNETFHHLAAKSIIRDFEQLAEKESEIEHGSGRRYQLNAIHASKACNVISKYTAFVPVDLTNNAYLPTVVEYANTGAGLKQRGHWSSGSRRLRGFSIGLGRSQSTCGQEAADEGSYFMSKGRFSSLESSKAAVPQRSPSVSSVHSQRSIESLFAARLTLNKTRLLTRAAKGFMNKSPGKMNEPGSEPENENVDYLPLVSLQLACGAFLLNQAFSDAINIPLEKLKWTSPFSCHRAALSPISHSSSSSSFSTRKAGPAGELRSPGHSGQFLAPEKDYPSSTVNGRAEGSEEQSRQRHFSGSTVESLAKSQKPEKELSPPAITIRRFSSPESTRAPSPSQADSGRGSETDSSELQSLLDSIELQQRMEPEGMLWATAVALAWLEHSSAAYFIEWELVAAKASMWLGEQEIPEGRNLAIVKATAQQLFVLLRHWDENLEFNVLCYNPSSV